MNYKEITKCRICGNENLILILDLGVQFLTGVFPGNRNQEITRGPLELVKCLGKGGGECCGLVQLRHSYQQSELYGENYGYRSGINQSMVKHLGRRVEKIMKSAALSPNDLVIDIGSNDSTLLQAYPDKELMLVGIDPTGKKFSSFYPSRVRLVPDFFSAKLVRGLFGGKKAKIITSIAMFYDLESPLDFMREVYEVLDEDGIWVFEQSYLPAMLKMNAYDTVCHEHLEYYCFRQIKWMADRVGFKILDVELNEVNGGSFCVTVGKKESLLSENYTVVEELANQEEKQELETLEPYREFKGRVHRHRDDLIQLIAGIKRQGKRILGYGASTKGNVILQFCGITDNDVTHIADLNPDKFGCYTPGTFIPIISEKEAGELRPDYKLILPWHFRESFLTRESGYLAQGGKLIMPLPAIEIISGK